MSRSRKHGTIPSTETKTVTIVDKIDSNNVIVDSDIDWYNETLGYPITGRLNTNMTTSISTGSTSTEITTTADN